jgi:lipoprotein-anchoring transpeptidase ErfK/SrfK
VANHSKLCGSSATLAANTRGDRLQLPAFSRHVCAKGLQKRYGASNKLRLFPMPNFKNSNGSRHLRADQTLAAPTLNRRLFLAGGIAASAALAGCAPMPVETVDGEPVVKPRFTFPVAPIAFEEVDHSVAYAEITDADFTLPAIPYQKIDQQFLRQMVPNTTGFDPGVLVVETTQHHLYWTMPGGFAMRYGVGLGKEGFEWSGEGAIKRKAKWPRWHPPAEMIERKPELKEYETVYNEKTKMWEGGMAGGLLNPLGARALYIYQGEVDTQFRLHGSPEWNSVGKSVSSGCVRLINQDVLDLHDRVPEGTMVVVR